jgi:hypothetical protein
LLSGEGFLASATRSALSIIDVAMRLDGPSKVFGRTEVVRAVHGLRAHHDRTLR